MIKRTGMKNLDVVTEKATKKKKKRKNNRTDLRAQRNNPMPKQNFAQRFW